MTSIAQEKKEEINEIFKREKESEIPDYLKSSLAHYICILTSSYLENSLRHVILDYTERKCPDQSIRKFINSSLERMRNPNYQNIKDLLEKFDLQVQLDNRQKETINSIYTNRNAIVHNGSPANLSLSRVEEYFEIICRVVDAIEQTFNVQEEPEEGQEVTGDGSRS